MKRVGEVALAALAAIVAVAALVRRSDPVAVARPVAPAGAAITQHTDGVAHPTSGFVASSSWWARLKGFVKELIAAVGKHRLTFLSAGLAYYGFFTMLPLAIAVVSIYGLLSDPADLERIFDELSSVFPGPTAEFLQTQLESLFAAPRGGLGLATGLSLLATLWSASASTRALMLGIDAVYEVDPTSRGLMVRLWALVSTLVLILVGVLLVAAGAFLPTILDRFDFGQASVDLMSLIRWPVLLVLIAVGLTLLYRSSPGSGFKRDGWFSMGAVLATMAILVVTAGLGFVVSRGSISEVYGTLTGLAVLMLWFFAAGLVVLIGAEVDRMFNRRRRTRAAATTTA